LLPVASNRQRCKTRATVTSSGRGARSELSREWTALIPAGAKLRAPTRRAEQVTREVLVARLVPHRGIVLLVAPPGFGKTTLLGQWKDTDGRPFAWVTLDGADNDPVVLWTYIILAIRAVQPAFGEGLDSALRVAGTDVTHAIIPQLLNELESLDGELVLVLEDYHSITSPACHGSLELFVEGAPSNVSLVLSGRADPPLPLGSMRVRGDFLELRAADLAFTDDETARFLNEQLGLGLSIDDLIVLQERTEGWPAGLYLAYLSIRDAPDRARFVTDFGGSNRHVVDYLTDVVVSRLDDPTRDFVLATSILERMCGPLCDAVAGRRGSDGLLVELEHANLFLVPLDDRREWYRYHRLFADLLQDELRRRQPEQLPGLHRRASEWLAASGDPQAAITHAIAAGELEAATRLVAENYLLTLEWGGVGTVAGWLQAFPRSAVVSDARLSIVEAWVMSFLTRRDEAEVALRNALLAGYEGAMPDGASSVEASVALLHAGVPWGDVGRMLTAARQAFELEGHRDSMWRVTTHVQLGWALYLTGDPQEARPYLEAAAVLAPQTGQWLNALGASVLLAWLALDEGRPAEAEVAAQHAVEIGEAHGLSGTSPGGWADATLGAALAGRGELDAADGQLARGLERLRAGTEPLILVQTLLALAKVRRALGSIGDARSLLGEARDLIDRCADPGILGVRVQDLTRSLTPAYRRIGGDGSLTERELEVLQLFEKGLSQRQAAQTLYLSYNTIHSHTRSIYRKLGAYSRDEAIQRARDLGLL
jgi:ATP/maltotriose-dependent transcriptional regulator MalT